MSFEIVRQTGNDIITSLPKEQSLKLLKHCERIELVFNEPLYHANQNHAYIYFPETCIISLVTLIKGHAPLGISLIGNEGILDAILILGNDLLPLHSAWVQIAGTALRMQVT